MASPGVFQEVPNGGLRDDGCVCMCNSFRVILLCLMNSQGFYTCLIICMNIVAHLDTNLILPSDSDSLTPESITLRIRGSKYVLIVEQSMIMTIWGCKICLLLMYRNLTFGLKQRWAVKVVGIYVVVNWVIMEILYFGVVRISISHLPHRTFSVALVHLHTTKDFVPLPTYRMNSSDFRAM